MTHPTDDLDPMLQPMPGVPMSATRRAELLQASTRVLRRGVLWRRSGGVVAVAMVFLVGGITGWVLKPTP